MPQHIQRKGELLSPSQFSLDPMPDFLLDWVRGLIELIDRKCPGEIPSIWSYRHRAEPYLHCEYENLSLNFRFGRIDLPLLDEFNGDAPVELWVKDWVDATTLLAIIEQRRQATPWPVFRCGIPNLDNQSVWEVGEAGAQHEPK